MLNNLIDYLRRWWFRGLLIILALASLVVFAALPFRPDHLEHLYFLDVGQGDAELIKTADNHYILIDGGPSDVVVNYLDHYLPIWHRRLDLVILTHPHADHATGLLSVAQRYPIAQFWYTGTEYDSETYRTLIAQISNKQIPVHLARQGDTIDLDATHLRVLFPLTEKPVAADPNETSIVNTLQYQNFTALFTGDASVNNEFSIISQLSDADILKVPHHGSNNSSSQEFVNAVRPKVAVIMVGAGNSYGLPNADILARYQSSGTIIYRTDQNGTVEVVTDGQRYTVYPSR